MRKSSRIVAGLLVLWAAAAAAATGLPREAVLERVPLARRSEVREIMADPTFVRTVHLEAVADPEVFIYLLDHPDLNSALGRGLQIAPARLARVGPGRYEGDDGEWNSGTLEVLWAEGDRRAFLEQGVSRGWWFGDIAGRVVAVTGFSREGRQLRGEVEVWAKIDQGVVDRLLRFLAPMLGGFLDHKMREQFGIAFRVAERAADDPDRFCSGLAGLAEGSSEDREELAGLAGCPRPAGLLDLPLQRRVIFAWSAGHRAIARVR